jgi:hypothetical protein
MPSQPKPGDPDFRPRYPPLDVEPVKRRIAERREAAKFHPQRAVLDADTDMMHELVLAVTNLRLALEVAKGMHRPPPTRIQGCPVTVSNGIDRANPDGPMQRCFTCQNWTPIDGPAKCAVCRSGVAVDDPQAPRVEDE